MEKKRSADHSNRKVQCPECRARLMDVTDPELEYRAVPIRKNDDTSSFAFTVKCARCKTMVGVFLRQSVA